MPDIGTVIRILRQTQDMGLGELARAASLSSPYLSLVEAGKRNPSLDVIGRIAKVLRVPVDVLLLSNETSGSNLHTDDEDTNALQTSIDSLLAAEAALRQRLGTGGPHDSVKLDGRKNRRRT